MLVPMVWKLAGKNFIHFLVGGGGILIFNYNFSHNAFTKKNGKTKALAKELWNSAYRAQKYVKYW